MHRHATRDARRGLQRKGPHDRLADVRLHFRENRLTPIPSRNEQCRVDRRQRFASHADVDNRASRGNHASRRTEG
jgi:hypothetical protein